MQVTILIGWMDGCFVSQTTVLLLKCFFVQTNFTTNGIIVAIIISFLEQRDILKLFGILKMWF